LAQLVEGKWVDTAPAEEEVDKSGRFQRKDSAFRSTITDEPDAPFRPEAGRYRLWVAYVCPWASRTLAYRVLKGLEDVISVSYARPGLPAEGWTFDAGPDGEAVEGGYPLHRLYTAHDPRYTGKVTVPVLWDERTGLILNNESAEIIRILNSAFDGITGNRRDLYPQDLRAEIDRWNDRIYPALNNGVYRAGFARSQDAYEEAARGVFDMLDIMERHLSRNRYLAGEWCTEADWRAFTTLVRFDAAYHGAFKCNLRRIDDYPALAGYLRELYQWPGIAGTVNIPEIKQGYYQLADKNRIIAIGPELDLTTPHGRNALPGHGIRERAA